MGLEITDYFYPSPWTTVDLDVSFSRARFVDVPAGEDFVPGALNRVVSGGVAVDPPEGVVAGPFGSVRLRHFGPPALLEDNSITSESTSLVNAAVGYKFSDQFRLVLEGFNLLDAEVSDSDYFFESRLRDELEAVEDVHFHAAIPRSARLASRVSF